MKITLSEKILFTLLGSAAMVMAALMLAVAVEARAVNEPYHSAGEIENSLGDLMQKDSQSYREAIGETVEGRQIWLYSFGPPSGGRFMFDGRMHGPEDCGTESGLEFIRYVLTSSDEEAQRIRQGSNLLFIPDVNLDRPLSRVNARNVNINRNFPAGWGSSGTSNPLDPMDYIGPSPGSEPETKAMIKAFNDYNPEVYFNVHCGQMLLSGGGNTTLSSRLVLKMREEARRLGSDAIGYYSPHYRADCGTGGYAKAQACDGDTSSWLFEVSEWQNLPDDVLGYREEFFKRTLPAYSAAALIVAVALPPAVPRNGSGELPGDNSPVHNDTPEVNITPPPVFINKTIPKNETVNKTKPRVSWLQFLRVTFEKINREEVERVKLD